MLLNFNPPEPELTFPQKEFDVIFESQQKKDPDFHFGLLDWDDIRNQVALHIHRKLHTFDKTRALCPWLKTVICNQITNAKRDAIGRNEKANITRTRYEQYFEYVSQLNNNPVDIKKECSEEIRLAIKSVWSNLWLKHKKIIIARLLNQESPEIIGARYGVTRRQIAKVVQIFKINCLKACKARKIHIRTEQPTELSEKSLAKEEA